MSDVCNSWLFFVSSCYIPAANPPASYPAPQAAKLLKAMLAYNAEERPLPEDVLKHEWFHTPVVVVNTGAAAGSVTTGA